MDCYGRTALHLAVTPVADWPPDRQPPKRQAVPTMTPKTRCKLVQWLLDNHPSCLKAVNNNEATPLHVAAKVAPLCADSTVAPLCMASTVAPPEVLEQLLQKSDFALIALTTTKSGV